MPRSSLPRTLKHVGSRFACLENSHATTSAAAAPVSKHHKAADNKFHATLIT